MISVYDKIKIKLSYMLIYTFFIVFPYLAKFAFFLLAILIFYLNYKFYDFIIKTKAPIENLLYVIACNIFSIVFLFLLHKLFIKGIKPIKWKMDMLEGEEETEAQE